MAGSTASAVDCLDRPAQGHVDGTGQMRATPLADDADGRQKAGSTAELRFAVEWPDGKRRHRVAPGALGTTRFAPRGQDLGGGNGLLETCASAPTTCAGVPLESRRRREVAVDRLLPSGRREAALRQQGGSWTLLEPVAGRADTTMAFASSPLLSLRVTRSERRRGCEGDRRWS
jgi:hypothetical protein